MAWIKLECSVHDKPEVIQMATILNMDEYAIVGRLTKLWIWADTHFERCDAVSVTKTFIDRHINHLGFADAMFDVGWLAPNKDKKLGLMFPNFERHNLQTAKNRALTKNRMENSRSKVLRFSDAASVTLSSPDKIREEKSNTNTINSSPDELQFDVFWKAYPKRVGKGTAKQAFKKALKMTSLDKILSALSQLSKSSDWLKDNGKFIKHPTTWLNSEGWNDEVEVVKVVHHPAPNELWREKEKEEVLNQKMKENHE